MSFGERIKEYIEYKRMKVRSFEIQSNLKNGAIHRVIKNNTSLNGESIAAIGKVWKDLNLNWLMTGDGDMLMNGGIVNEPLNEYNKNQKLKSDILWHEDALRRADAQIKLQNDLIAALNLIIENQKKEAKRAGIDL